MEFTITARNGDSVKIEAGNWMLAMGKALPFFRVDLPEAGGLRFAPGEDRAVFVEAGDGKTWMIREVEPLIRVVVAGQVIEDDDTDEAPDAASAHGPPPTLEMPLISTLRPLAAHPADNDADTLAERLDDLAVRMGGASMDEACSLALDLVVEFVPAEAASVARGTINDPCLTFVSAAGPVSADIVGRTIPFGQGLVGLSFDMGGTLVVNDAASDARHLSRVDRETGFHTLASLCVPVASQGHTLGVIQVLNPSGTLHFSEANVEAVEQIAGALGSALLLYGGGS